MVYTQVGPLVSVQIAFTLRVPVVYSAPLVGVPNRTNGAPSPSILISRVTSASPSRAATDHVCSPSPVTSKESGAVSRPCTTPPTEYSTPPGAVTTSTVTEVSYQPPGGGSANSTTSSAGGGGGGGGGATITGAAKLFALSVA